MKFTSLKEKITVSHKNTTTKKRDRLPRWEGLLTFKVLVIRVSRRYSRNEAKIGADHQVNMNPPKTKVDAGHKASIRHRS